MSATFHIQILVKMGTTDVHPLLCISWVCYVVRWAAAEEAREPAKDAGAPGILWKHHLYDLESLRKPGVSADEETEDSSDRGSLSKGVRLWGTENVL